MKATRDRFHRAFIPPEEVFWFFLQGLGQSAECRLRRSGQGKLQHAAPFILRAVESDTSLKPHAEREVYGSPHAPREESAFH